MWTHFPENVGGALTVLWTRLQWNQPALVVRTCPRSQWSGAVGRVFHIPVMGLDFTLSVYCATSSSPLSCVHGRQFCGGTEPSPKTANSKIHKSMIRLLLKPLRKPCCRLQIQMGWPKRCTMRKRLSVVNIFCFSPQFITRNIALCQIIIQNHGMLEQFSAWLFINQKTGTNNKCCKMAFLFKQCGKCLNIVQKSNGFRVN